MTRIVQDVTLIYFSNITQTTHVTALPVLLRVYSVAAWLRWAAACST